MSESLYRGISKQDGFWVYGAYCPHDDRGFIMNVGIDNVGPIAHVIEVYPETVGQFTGLYDATKWEDLTNLEKFTCLKEQWQGKKVFEGDILEAHYDKNYPEDATRTVVVWHNDMFDHLGVGWFIDQRPGFGDPLEPGDVTVNKVIGNIHQNKDLLEEGSGWV